MAGEGPKRDSKSGLVVVSALKDWSCAECGGGGSLLTMDDRGPLCLSCADLDHLHPGCPQDRAEEIACHTGTRGSGRVGRSAAGRALEPGALKLAVAASVRHRDTGYDKLLMSGVDRAEARLLVRDEVERVLESWRAPSG